MAASTRFAALAARPPTPPKDHESTKGVTEAGFPVASTQTTCISIDTPDESPHSAIDYFPTSSDKPSKRVGFLLEKNGALPFSTSSPEILPIIRSHPSSRHSKPVKSILKQTNNPSSDPPDDSSPAALQRDFPRMLDDLARQLAGQSQSARLDAYMALNGCLKTYKNMPEQQALEEKMPLLSGFIRRDLCETMVEDGARSTQLATEVVRLVTTLLWSPTMGDMFTDDFQSFILNQSIASVGSDKTPKTLINQYLHLLAIQNLRGKIMNSDRANRLLTTLKHLHERVRGRQVLAHRLDIYKKLLHQARSLMVARIRDWHECIFYGLLSSTKEIRLRALSLGFEAGVDLGAVEQVSRAVRNLFAEKSASEDTKERFGDVFCARLNLSLDSKDDARLVPQIWSVVVLFLRYQPRQFESWAFTAQWLRILQKCFNSSDTEVRFQANRAWTRLIYTINPGLSTGENMVALLRDPIRLQLDRLKTADKDNKKTKLSIYATYFTLLYYSFRPGVDYASLDRYWKAYVVPFVAAPVGRVPTLDTKVAVSVLLSLLGDGRQEAWLLDRASQPNPIKYDEIACIEPKWIRLKVATVLEVLEPLLLSEAWWISDSGPSPILRVWQAFVKALADAASKEVKVSRDAMNALAELLGSLKRFYDQSSSRMLSVGMTRIASLVDIILKQLGPLPLIEKRLVQTSANSFQAAETPSSRSTPKPGILASPLSHILDFISYDVDEHATDAAYRVLVSNLTSTALKASLSRHSKLKTLRDLFPSKITDAQAAQRSMIVLWEYVSESAALALKSPTPGEAVGEGSQYPGQDFREVSKLLETGARLGEQATTSWSQLLSEFDSHVRSECGIAASALAVVEPVAQSLAQIAPTSSSVNYAGVLKRTAELLRLATWPESRKDVEKSQKMLWGFGGLGNKSSTAGAFDFTCALIAELLTDCYVGRRLTIASAEFVTMISAIKAFASAAPSSAYTILLKRVQSGLALWIEDSEGLLKADSPESTAAFRAIIELWVSVVERIQGLGRFDMATLDALEALLTAGLSSRHRAIANKSIGFWNMTFGIVEGLEYSQRLYETLLRLKAIVDICAPGIDSEDGITEIESTPIDYIDTIEELQEGMDVLGTAKSPLEGSGHFSLSKYALDENAKIHSPIPAKLRSNTPQKIGQSPKPRSTPRLRHEDSQVQFAAIDSSPVDLNTLESQLLTDRQKEVTERQHSDAALMFPDLRSSPRPKSQDRNLQLPRLELKDRPLDSSDIEDDQSPTLPPPGSTTFFGSSPTPSQRRSSSKEKSTGNITPSSVAKAIADATLDVTLDPPSSPPVVLQQGHGTKNASLLAEEGLSAPVAKSAVNSPPRLRSKSRGRAAVSKDSKASSIPGLVENDSVRWLSVGDPDDPADLVRDTVNADANRTVIKTNEPRGNAGAPVQPGKALNIDSEIAAIHFNSQSTATKSTGLEQNDGTPDDHKQVEAQILVDMERALSQSQTTVDSTPLPNSKVRGGEKRKASPAFFGARAKKRARGRPRKLVDCIRPIAEPTAGEEEEEMLDCIIVSSPIISGQQRNEEASTEKETTPPGPPAGRRSRRKRPIDRVSETSDLPEAAQSPKRKRARSLRSNLSKQSPSPEIPSRPSSPPVERSEMIEQPSESNKEKVGPEATSARDDMEIVATESIRSEDANKIPGTSSQRLEETASAAGDSVPASPTASAGEAAAASAVLETRPIDAEMAGESLLSGAGFLARVRQLLDDAKRVVLSGEGDEIVTSLMDVGKEIVEAKKRAA